MTEPNLARFAVGDFQDWDAACKTVDGLQALGVRQGAISLLGLRRLFHADAAAPPQHGASTVREFTFRQGPGIVCCTAGVLADHLAGPGSAPASLGNAFSRWLVPDAARRIQQSVEDGVLLVWVQVFDAADERRACTGLLTYCLSGVEVHDFVAFRVANGNGRTGGRNVSS